MRYKPDTLMAVLTDGTTHPDGPPIEVDPLWMGPILSHHHDQRLIMLAMGYNVRMVIVRDDQESYDYGWCYRSPVDLVMAAMQFDLDTQDEPLGWHKRSGWRTRRAPRRHQHPGYNRPRCVHGTYLDADRCAQVEICDEFPGRAPWDRLSTAGW